MKHLIVLALIITVSFGISAQQFQKVYKPTSSSMQSMLECAIQTSDGGYLMVGWENYLPVKMYAIKTDAQGVVTWAKRYGKELFMGTEDPTAYCMFNYVSQNPDGTYITSGSVNGKCFLMKLTNVGAVSWTKQYGGSDGSGIYCVKRSSDGGYIACGYTYSNDTKDSSNVYILKAQSNGNFSWDRIYRYSSVGDDIAYACTETSDGFVFAGASEQINGTDTTTDIILMKTNTTGTIQWSGTFGNNTTYDEAYDIITASDGNVLVSGSTEQTSSSGDAFVWKVSNATGSVQWGKAINVGLAETFVRVREYGGQIHLFGFNLGLTLYEMFASRLASDGSSVIQTVKYSQLLNGNLLRSAHVCTDGSYLIGGFDSSPLGQNFMLIKTNSNGFSGCNEFTYSAGMNDFAPHVENVTPTNYGPTSASTITMLSFNVTPEAFVVCEVTALIASAGNTTNLCQGSSTTLGGSPTASGGVGPYTYSWSSSPASFTSTSANPTVTPTGNTTYTVTVTDNSGTTATSSITVTMVPNPSAYAGSDVTICEGQSTQLQATGGGTYSWSPTTALTNPAISNPIANPSSTTTYTVTVSDANNCTATDQVTVNVNSAPTAVASNTGPYCTGNTIQLNSSGGASYMWNGPNGFSSTSQNPTITNADATMNGVYTVVVTGDNSCTALATTTVSVGSPPNPSASGTGPYCEGETITLFASGGATYYWTGPNSFSSIEQNPQITNSTSSMSGTYTVAVSDAGGCAANATVNIVVNPTPNADAGANTGVCFGNSIQLNATGGGTYSWSPSGTLDNANIYNPVASPLVNTIYYVTVTNDHNCTDVDSIEVQVRPLPTAFAITGGGQFCPGGAGAPITLSGSETDVNYNLTLSGNTEQQLPGTGSTLVFNATQPGTYTVVAVDAIAGCSATMTGTVTVSTYPQPLLNANVTDITCYGDTDGNISVSVSSGSPPYTYDWSHDASNHSSGASGLINGDYTITVTDNNSCTATYTATIIQPGTLTITCTPGNVSCYGDSNGTASASPNGGTSPFLYAWSNGGNSAIVSGLAVGSYSVTVTDSHGCTAAQNTIVGQPSPILMSDSLVNVSCYGLNDGLVSLTMTGGNEPFTYYWSNGSTLSDLSAVGAGTYIVTVTDNNGCIVTDTFTLTQPGAIYVTITSGMGSDHYGYANSTATGGSGSLSYAWSTGSINTSISGLNSGSYYLTVTDLAGCFTVDTAIIDIPVIIPNAISPNNDGKNDDFEILGVGGFPKVTIEIFTRWGKKIFFFEGTGPEYSQSSNRWDGTHKGKGLPMGAYQYIIHLEGYSDPFTGQVLLVY